MYAYTHTQPNYLAGYSMEYQSRNFQVKDDKVIQKKYIVGVDVDRGMVREKVCVCVCVVWRCGKVCLSECGVYAYVHVNTHI
jgi:hypothetical protein